MKYEILDTAEREASVEFYKAYFYGSGDLSLLLNHLDLACTCQLACCRTAIFP